MKKLKLFIFIIICIFILIGLGTSLFFFNLRSVDKNNKNNIDIKIESGMSVDNILNTLKEKELIRNKLFSKIYIKLTNYNMQAGEYELNKSMSSIDIIKAIANGKVTDKNNIILTFKEGQNIRDYAKIIAKNTNNKESDVFNLLEDTSYIDSLINKYWFLTDDIKSSGIYYPLEGYLFPETYYFENKDVSVKTIFEKLLNQTDKILSKNRNEIESKKLNIHEFMTLASIVELEGKYDNDRSMIAGVFNNRLKSGQNLGSDVTTYYAVKKEMGSDPVLWQSDIDFDSPYNTRLPKMAGKLPIGPISNPGESSINAVINPTNSNYYFFVADCKSGKTVFTTTYNEHIIAVNKIKNSGCAF